MYSTHHEENLLLLKDLLQPSSKMCKYVTSISKHVYINKLNDIVHEYNITTIKVKPVDVKSNTYIDFGIDNNDKDPKFEVQTM